MLKILIVDDEKFIRRGLSTIISESCEEYEVVGEAENGVEALRLIELNKPDVIITDIKMPKMDGLELIKNLEIHYPDMKKIVLSGFDEFNFVRETMKSGALDYLLKPVVEDQLSELLRSIAKNIEIENERRVNALNLKIKLNESMPLLRDVFLNELICEGRYASETDIEKKLQYYNINVNPDGYFIMLVSMDNSRFLFEKLGTEAFKINHYIIRNIAEESVSKGFDYFSFQGASGLVIACSFNGSPDMERADRITQMLYSNLSNYAKVRFTLSMGKPVDSFQMIRASYESALKALEYRFYQEKSSITSYSGLDQCFFNSYPEQITNEFEKALTTCMGFNDPIKVKTVLDDFCLKLKSLAIEPIEAVKAFADVYMRLQVHNVKFKESVVETFGFNYSYIKTLDLFNTLDELKNYTLDVYTEVIRKMIVISGKKDKRIIQAVKDYIDKHYSEDMNLNKVADIAYVNSNYLSELFKSQTGENFVDYFTKVRMEKAKFLLKDIRVKTYEVGELVGYNDPAYFSKVFKKVVGISPSDYRNLIG